MRGIRAKGAIGIGLAVVLVLGAFGGWLLFGPKGSDKDPIVVGSTSPPTSVDPGAATDAAAWYLMSNLYQSLLTFVPGKEEPEPDAAESCGFTDTELTVYRCTLREGLTFSNGREITPDDVKFSYDRILAMGERASREADDPNIPEGEKFNYSGPITLLSSLEAVRVDGQDIVFELSHTDATFPFIVAGTTGAIVDREKYEELEVRTDNKVDGSGPYLLKSFTPDVSAELVPNPNYDGPYEVSDFPITVRYFVQDEDGTSAEDLLAESWDRGEIDVADGKLPPEVVAEINSASPEYRVYESTGGSIRVMTLATDIEGSVMSDETVRQVAAAVLDRQAIARQVQRNTVEPLYSLIPVGFTGHGTPYHDLYGDVPDPAELTQKLESAGYELPVPFTLAYSRGAANHEEAELIQQQLEADGLFDVEIEYYDWQEFIPMKNAGEFEAYLIGWRPDYPDPATFTDSLLGPGDSMRTGYVNSDIYGLIEDTQAESDRGRTDDSFREIHELAADAATIVPIWQEKRLVLAGPDITGLQHLQGSSGVWRLWELSRL